ncbi:mspn-1, partial [Symbiodinium microadriaticum]
IFDNCDKLGGVVIFIDEIDALVGNRDNAQMHEATRRILSVILQRVEGFTGRGKNVLVCATNRKQDLDRALLSRFDVCIRYDLPDMETRRAIFKRYAKHLGRTALSSLAGQAEGLSSRDIKDICERAERTWASRMISQGKLDAVNKELPLSHDYMESLRIKLEARALHAD